jgi:CrcB protein
LNPNWLWHAFLVGAGGFAGSILRFGVGGLAYRLFPSATVPIGTLAVNVIGCLAIGVLGGVGDARQIAAPEFRLLLMVGLLGGFTTFSAFGYEVLVLVRADEPVRAVVNVGLHLVLGLIAVWIGYTLGSRA